MYVRQGAINSSPLSATMLSATALYAKQREGTNPRPLLGLPSNSIAERLIAERAADPRGPAGRVDERLVAVGLNGRCRLIGTVDEGLIAVGLDRCGALETTGRLSDQATSIAARNGSGQGQNRDACC